MGGDGGIIISTGNSEINIISYGSGFAIGYRINKTIGSQPTSWQRIKASGSVGAVASGIQANRPIGRL